MRKATGRPQYSMRQNLEGYSFIGLFVIGFLAFTVIPIGTSLVLSFTKYDILSPPQFIGLDNFVQMLTGDHQFWVSFGVTLFYVIVSVPLRLAFALAVAMLLQKKQRSSQRFIARHTICPRLSEAASLFPWYGGRCSAAMDCLTVSSTRYFTLKSISSGSEEKKQRSGRSLSLRFGNMVLPC